MRKLYLGSDHAGLRLKDFIKQHIIKQYKCIEIEDVGTNENSSCHYPDFAEKISQQIKPQDRAIVTCGSGIGIGIAMAKSGITCATVWNQYTAEECGKKCQAMAVGERIVTPEVMKLMIAGFLSSWVKIN